MRNLPLPQDGTPNFGPEAQIMYAFVFCVFYVPGLVPVLLQFVSTSFLDNTD